MGATETSLRPRLRDATERSFLCDPSCRKKKISPNIRPLLLRSTFFTSASQLFFFFFITLIHILQSYFFISFYFFIFWCYELGALNVVPLNESWERKTFHHTGPYQMRWRWDGISSSAFASWRMFILSYIFMLFIHKRRMLFITDISLNITIQGAEKGLVHQKIII